MSDKTGFFEALFDLSFSSFITTRLIKALYILAMILAGFLALGIVIAGFSNGFVSGLGALIFGALVFLIYVMTARVTLELIMIVFRISENVSVIANRRGAESSTQPL